MKKSTIADACTSVRTKDSKRTNAEDSSFSPTGAKPIVSSRFSIDFFEFSFLVEACIPPRPIARAMFWDEVINKYYHVLTENERVRLFEWINRCSAFDLKNEDCRLFYARFNPENQYEVETEFEGKKETIKCFKWNDQFHRDKRTSVIEKYIVNVKWLSNGCQRQSIGDVVELEAHQPIDLP